MFKGSNPFASSNILIETKEKAKFLIYEIEPYTYKGKEYSQIKLELKEPGKIDTEIVDDGKKITIEAQEEIKVEDDKLVVLQPAVYQKTVGQKVTDKTKETAQEIGDTSSEAVKKTGQTVKGAGEKLEEAAKNKEWPRWVLPVLIILLLTAVIGVIIWFANKPTKKQD